MIRQDEMFVTGDDLKQVVSRLQEMGVDITISIYSENIIVKIDGTDDFIDMNEELVRSRLLDMLLFAESCVRSLSTKNN